jgi:mono/diheme cytochrome c family protein
MARIRFQLNPTPLLVLGILFLTSFGFKMYQDDWVVPDQYKNMENPYVNYEDEDDIGKDLYTVHCRSCHGKTGLGDGSKAFDLESEVIQFTSQKFKSQTDGSMYFKMIIGRNEMPAFDKKIKSEEDRWLLINYIKSF